MIEKNINNSDINKIIKSVLGILDKNNINDSMDTLVNSAGRYIHKYFYPYKTKVTATQFYDQLIKVLDALDEKELKRLTDK